MVVLHELVKRYAGATPDVPPAPEVGLPEPVLEGEPAEGLHHQLPLPEVRGLMDTRQVTGQGAGGAQDLQ